MIVDAGGVGNILQKLIHQCCNFGCRHARVQLLRFRRFVRDRLHGQMKHYLESAAMRLPGDVRGVLVIGQNGNGEGITQSENGFGSRAVAAEIVDDNCEARVRSYSAGILRCCTGNRRSARHDFDFDRRHACMSKLKLKKIPSLNRRVLRQMIAGCDGIETLNELCDCCTVGVCRAIIFQHDAQVIRASGLLAGSALAEFNGSPGRHR